MQPPLVCGRAKYVGAVMKKALYELSGVLRRADITGGCRISITFDDPRDTAFFEREVRRELEQEILYSGPVTSLSELTLYGIRMRII